MSPEPTLPGILPTAHVNLAVFLNPDSTLSHYTISAYSYDGHLIALESTNVPSRSVEGTAMRHAHLRLLETVVEAQRKLRLE